MALTRARRDDPCDVALVAYKKHISSGDGAINEAIKRRSDAYSCIIELLRLLQMLAISHGTQLATLNLGNIFPSADSIKRQLSPSQAQMERDKVLGKVLESDDELACVHVFQWMLANNMGDNLISVWPMAVLKHLSHQNIFSFRAIINTLKHFFSTKSRMVKAMSTWNYCGNIMRKIKTIWKRPKC